MSSKRYIRDIIISFDKNISTFYVLLVSDFIRMHLYHSFLSIIPSRKELFFISQAYNSIILCKFVA